MSNVLLVTKEHLTADYIEYTAALAAGSTFSGLVLVDDEVASRNLMFPQGAKIASNVNEISIKLKATPGVVKRFKLGEQIAQVYRTL